MTLIGADNSPQAMLDNDVTLHCPHCGVLAGMTAISIPRFELIHRFRLRQIGVCYRCDACNAPVTLIYDITLGNPIRLPPTFTQIQRALEPFAHEYLPAEVASDFKEALLCYSHSSWNAFAAMCRRCIQSISMDLGADGSTKVQQQLKELRDLGAVDDEAFEQLQQVMLSGHDGAHPHLPKLSPERAAILLQLMKDVLYQLYVRPGKIREAATLRAQQQK